MPSRIESEQETNPKSQTEPTASKLDSEDEDEDYKPPEDGDDEDGAIIEGASPAMDPLDKPLSAAKRKIVDEAFDSLFKRQRTDDYGKEVVVKKGGKKRSKTRMMKNKKLLEGIFGVSAAEKMISGYGIDDDSNCKPNQDSEGRSATSGISNERLEALIESVKEVKNVTTTRRFAGQDVQIQVAASASAASRPKAVAAPVEEKETKQASAQIGGVDKVLADIAAPQKISAVAKTSSDWDQFKQKHSLEEELEKKAKDKDAYLVKKDFLNRVDERRFEHEKAEREMKRSKESS